MKYTRSVYLVRDVWSYIARIFSTFDDNVFVLVTVQQFKCFPNLADNIQTEL